MKTCIVLVTYNRLDYTKKCLDALLSSDEQFELVIWDNASTDGTREFLAHPPKDKRIARVELFDKNLGPTYAINRVWQSTDATLVGKLDNDCLVTPGWIRALGTALTETQELGALACWHYRLEDFDLQRAQKKVQTIGRHRVFRHPWICGSGFLMRRALYEEMGPVPEGCKGIGLSDYFLRIAARGYVNGWYYPFILQDHMDDPYSPHSVLKDDESIRKAAEVTYVLREFGIKSMKARLDRRQTVLDNLHIGPWEAEAYLGLRGKIRRRFPAWDRIRASLALS
ncbi:MAG: glycosyltransferase [Verrucomicrobia bacterium]|nr:glycosyltransferase [Verrucomicrobiota bacterium]